MPAGSNPRVCPDRVELEEYVRGACRDAGLQTHVGSCQVCAALLAEIEADNALLRRFGRRGVAAPQRPALVAPQIDGYSIIEEIHRGGQGIVYRALQMSTRREVAIKVMREGQFAGHNDRVRFDREVHILAQLEHPNIVTIHDSGVASGCHYFVMDYVRGRTLDDYLSIASAPTLTARPSAAEKSPAAGGSAHPGSIPRALNQAELEARLRLFIKICEAVNAAHLRGVIHRDLKPGNIIVDESGEPHVLDFGLARDIWAEQSAPPITLSAHFVGTPHWASPEQAAGRSGQLDLRSDVYALGLILYHLLTGIFPYDVRGALPEIIHQIRTAEPRPLTALRLGFDDELNTLTLKCLAKEPERRYETAGALARDVGRYLAHEPLDARRDSVWYVLRKRLRRYRLPLFLGSASLIALVVFAITMSFLYRRAFNAEQSSSSNARQLAAQLSISNLERGRALGAVGSVQSAEDLLWGELLQHSVDPPGIEHCDPAFWSLIELYVRSPCLCTRALDGGQAHDLVNLDSATQTATIFSQHGEIEHWDWRRMVRLDRIAENLSQYLRPVGGSVGGRQMLQFDYAGGTFKLRDLHTGAVTSDLSSLAGTAFNQLAMLPSGRWLIAIDPAGDLRRFSLSESGELHEAGRYGDVAQRRVSIVGQRTSDWLAVLTADGGTEVWDFSSATPRRVWSRADVAGGRQISPDHKWIAFTDLNTAELCVEPLDDRDQGVKSPMRTMLLSQLDFDPSGERLAASGSNSTDVYLFDIRPGAIQTLPGHRAVCRDVRFLPDGQHLLSIDAQSKVKLWALPERNPGVRRSSSPGTVLALHYDALDDALLVSTSSGALGRAAANSSQVALWIEAHPQPVGAVAVEPAGQWIATCGYEGTIKLWNRSDKSLRATLEAPTHARFIALSYAPQTEQLAAACEDRQIYIWNVRTGASRTLDGHAGPANCVEFSRDGRWLASGDRGGEVILRATQSLEVVHRIPNASTRLRALALSPDGLVLATGGEDRSVKLWSTSDGSLITSLEAHREPVFALAFRPDGKVLASGDTGGVVTLWDVAGRRNLIQLHANQNAVYALAFSSSGTRLASGGQEQHVVVFDLAYLERYPLGNLEAAIERQGSRADPRRVQQLRAWAGKQDANLVAE